MTWPYTMTTPYWSDFVPNSTFYRILSGFHRTFATGVACRQGTLTPPDTLSRPCGTCICSTCWDHTFSELVGILPDYALRISLGTFSILLSETTVRCTATYFFKIVGCSRWFCAPLSFEAVYCFICSLRRVAVARYRMICLVLLINL